MKQNKKAQAEILGVIAIIVLAILFFSFGGCQLIEDKIGGDVIDVTPNTDPILGVDISENGYASVFYDKQLAVGFYPETNKLSHFMVTLYRWESCPSTVLNYSFFEGGENEPVQLVDSGVVGDIDSILPKGGAVNRVKVLVDVKDIRIKTGTRYWLVLSPEPQGSCPDLRWMETNYDADVSMIQMFSVDKGQSWNSQYLHGVRDFDLEEYGWE